MVENEFTNKLQKKAIESFRKDFFAKLRSA